MVLSPDVVDAYLARLGWETPTRPEPSFDSLRRLHLAHLQAVPFEDLSIHVGEPIVLDVGALVDKVVRRRRGGFCYELNGAFAGLLEALSFEVTMLEAGVVFDGGKEGPPFDHMTLRVDIDGASWLADVGFGACFFVPLPLDDRTDHDDPGGVFRISAHGDGELELSKNGVPEYRFRPGPHVLADYEAMCRFHQTSPESHFTHNSLCSLPLDGGHGRVSMRYRTLIITRDGERTEQELTTADEVRHAYLKWFGIELDALPPR